MPITPPSDVVTGTERPTRAPMAASDLIALLDRLQDAAIAVWLDGGWGVDALLGEQTREHDDLDLVSTVDDARGLIETLNAAGYRLAAGDPSTNFVLLDSDGRQVDVHPVRFDADGNGVYRMLEGGDWIYPAEGFTGFGLVADRAVRCLSPAVQVLCHAGGYEPDEDDRRDMRALRDRFGVTLPPGLA